jgi:hypothetical protein
MKTIKITENQLRKLVNKMEESDEIDSEIDDLSDESTREIPNWRELFGEPMSSDTTEE